MPSIDRQIGAPLCPWVGVGGMVEAAEIRIDLCRVPLLFHCVLAHSSFRRFQQSSILVCFDDPNHLLVPHM